MSKYYQSIFLTFFLISIGYSQNQTERYESGKRYGYIKGFEEVIELVVNAKEKVIKFDLEDLEKLVAELVYYPGNHNEFSIPIISTFNKYKVLSEEEQAYDYLMKWRNPKFKNSSLNEYFITVKFQNYFFLPDSNEVLVEMHGLATGGESYPYVLILFGFENERLYLKGILDQIYAGSFGDIKIVEIIKISEDSYILIGLSESGDVYDKWGHIWISYWELPLDLEVLYKKKFDCNLAERKKEITYQFKKTDFAIELFVNEQVATESHSFEYGSWRTIEKDTIDVSKKIMEIRKRKYN